MNVLTKEVFDRLELEHPELNSVKTKEAYQILLDSYRNGGKLLVCGNGGSAADALHIVGELMKGFKLKRKIDASLSNRINNSFPEVADLFNTNLQQSLPAISLVSEVSLMTAFSNDQDGDLVFAQQVLGYGRPNDVLLAISTSGNSKNVLFAAQMAKVLGLRVISLTGDHGGKLKDLSDVCLNVPEHETYKIQEQHIIIYHALCAALETEFFGETTV